MRDFWEDYPAWFYVITSFFFEFYAKTNVPARSYSTAAFIFPLAFFVLYVMKKGKDRNDKYYPLTRITIVLLIWGLIEKLVPPLNFTESTLKWIYEISNFVLWIGLVAHSLWRFGKRTTIEFFVITLIYGFLLENGGVSSGFFAEDNFHIYIPLFNAPLVTMIGWSAIVYTSYFIFDEIRSIDLPLFKTVIGGALTITLIALFWDLNLDPVASSHYVRFWQWNELLSTEPSFMGVPLLNFVAWFYAVFCYSVVYLYYKKKNPPTPYAYLYLFAGALIAQVMAGLGVYLTMLVIEGSNGPTATIFKNHFRNMLH